MTDVVDTLSLEEHIIEEPITKKDPKRVEQGKRLAMISREAKERKMREKIEKENFTYTKYIFPVISVVSTSGLIYLLFFKREQRQEHPNPQPVEQKETPKPKNQQKKFEGFN